MPRLPTSRAHPVQFIDRSSNPPPSVEPRDVALVKEFVGAHRSMTIHNRAGGLTAEEKKIVKALLAKKWSNQDIQHLLNSGGRKATVNGARITGVKQTDTIKAANDAEVQDFMARKQLFDPATGLNALDDERLIRAREAMILAVQVFNGPGYKFKTELFAVLANIAWTYLLHEFYARKKVAIVGADGRSLLLGNMVERHDCPLSSGIKNSLRAMKIIRDEVEHLFLKRSDKRWATLFQACCLNFESMLKKYFGEQLSLQPELAFALQFAKMDLGQAVDLQQADVPADIAALDARLVQGMMEADIQDLEYQFRVIYTPDSANKDTAHIQFFLPGGAEGREIHNVLTKFKIADDAYPHKSAKVVQLVKEKSGKNFNSNNHVQAWRHLKARPKSSAAQPANTNKEFASIIRPIRTTLIPTNGWNALSLPWPTMPSLRRSKPLRCDLTASGAFVHHV